MPKVIPVTKDDIITEYLVKSPRSNIIYSFWTKESNKYWYWNFNNDFTNPTFAPSMINYSTNERFFVIEGKIYYMITENGTRRLEREDMIDFELNDSIDTLL